MKQLTCEMCGGTDLVKQDGVFVCQSCGTKYSVEEAKKMMVEVSGSVNVKNAAQLENLLNLAKSSYESKNFAQTEAFCNQIIAIDNTSYEAWKLKGLAINYQVNSKNQRILEAYNCIMTSYRILPDQEKPAKKKETINLLIICFESEVEFWLKQIEAGRPTDAALVRAKNSYVDSCEKMKSAFDELGLEKEKQEFLTSFSNFFCRKANDICMASWKSTVGYNYYREYMGQGPFKQVNGFSVLAHTDLYRPTKAIWDTFLSETDNLIALLQYAEKQFTEDTDPVVMKNIYHNIIFFEKEIIPSASWHIVLGNGPLTWFDGKQVFGWRVNYTLTDSAIRSRCATVAKYEEKERAMSKVVDAHLKAMQEALRKAKIALYWADHTAEKEELEQEQADIKKKTEGLSAQIDAIDNKNAPTISELIKERDKTLLCEIDANKQEDLIRSLESQRDELGFFKIKEKKEIRNRIDNEELPKLEALKTKAEAERKAHRDRFNAEINALKNEGKELRDEFAQLKKRSDEIAKELTKDR